MALFLNNKDPDLSNNNLWYQQDGVPPHYAASVRRYLDEVFLNRWTERGGAKEFGTTRFLVY